MLEKQSNQLQKITESSEFNEGNCNHKVKKNPERISVSSTSTLYSVFQHRQNNKSTITYSVKKSQQAKASLKQERIETLQRQLFEKKLKIDQLRQARQSRFTNIQSIQLLVRNLSQLVKKLASNSKNGRKRILKLLIEFSCPEVSRKKFLIRLIQQILNWIANIFSLIGRFNHKVE